MKTIFLAGNLILCALAIAGCSPQAAGGGSTATGTIAPSAASMSAADKQERLRQVMPKGMPQSQGPGKR